MSFEAQGPEFNKEQKPEIVEFSANDLIQLISSEKFLKTLGIVGRETKKSGHETSFIIDALPDKSAYFFADIVKGGTTGFTAGQDILKKDRINDPRHLNQSRVLLDLHLHPDKDGAIVPSADDLIPFISEDRSIMTIGQVAKNADIVLLFIKADKPLIMEDIDAYEEETEPDLSDQEKIMAILSKYGIKTALLKFKYQRGKYSPDDLTLDQIKKMGNVKIKF